MSVWCAAGLITVATSESAVVRVAVPAPPWVGVVALVIAMLVRGWRTHPITAAPALFAVLPWLPLPLPPIALVWTGPLAWAPIGCALVAAMLVPASKDRPGMPGASTASATPALKDGPGMPGPSTDTSSAIVAAALTLILSIAAAAVLVPRLPGGDEPHYLVITQSLLHDRDLDITNNHAARQYTPYHPAEMRPDFIKRGRNGEIYSIHAPGVPAMVLPAFALFGYRGAQATIMLLAAIAGALVWSIAWRASGDRRAAWFAWAAVVLTPTFLLQSVTIYPDGPGAVATVAAVWLLMRLRDVASRPSTRAIVVVSILLAALPWMHTRFATLAGVFGVAILYRLWRALGGPGMPGPSNRFIRMMAFCAAPTVSAVAWFATFYVLYGTFDPTFPYGPPGRDRSIAFAPGGIAGLFFDQQFGIVAFAPVLLVAIAGAVAAWRSEWRAVAAASFAAALVYLVATGMYWMWWAGVPAPPARFAMAILPIAALPLAVAWRWIGHPARALAATALAWSAAVTACVILVGRGELAWNVRDGQAEWLNWLGPVVNLPRGWPSFFWDLTPADVSTEWPFARHVTLWLGTIAAVAAVTIAIGRRSTAPRAAALAGGAALVAVMAFVQAGWWLNGAIGLDPTRSQLAAIGAVRAGRSAIALGAMSVGSGAGAMASMVVRPEEAPRFRPDWPSARFVDVPPGDYVLTVSTTRAGAGELTVRVDEAVEPIARYQLVPVRHQTQTLSLPEGARALSIDLSADLKPGGSVTLGLR